MSEAIIISAFVAGAILGSRFSVFVLAPAMLFATVGSVAISFAKRRQPTYRFPRCVGGPGIAAKRLHGWRRRRILRCAHQVASSA